MLLIRPFLNNTSIHGLAEITRTGRTPAERSLWIVSFIICVIAMILIIMQSWHKYQSHPTVITIERNRNEWVFRLPAIIQCMQPASNRRLVKRFIKKHPEILASVNKTLYTEFITAVGNLAISNFKVFEKFQDLPFHLNMSLSDIQNQIKDYPKDMVMHVELNEFYTKDAIKTEYGVCYSSNSALANETSLSQSSTTETNAYMVELSGTAMVFAVVGPPKYVKIFVNSAYEFPHVMKDYMVFREKMNNFKFYGYNLELTATVSNPSIKELSPQQRNCFFRDEKKLEISPFYTSLACKLQCRYLQSIEKCGCSPHVFYNFGNYNECNINGLVCFARELGELADTDNLQKCSCYPPCEDQNFMTLEGIKEKDYPREVVAYMLSQFPTIRYKRDLMFGKLEVIVSLGGIAGLFFGGSVTSLVEFIYFIAKQTFSAFMKVGLSNLKCRKHQSRWNTQMVHSEKFAYILPSSINNVITYKIPHQKGVSRLAWNLTTEDSIPSRTKRRKKCVTFNRKVHSMLPSRFIREIFGILIATLTEYLQHSTLHGIKYIGSSTLQWFERIFWLLVCLSFVGIACMISLTLWNSYYYNPLAYEMENDYMTWNTSVPALSLCSIGMDWTAMSCESILHNCSINGKPFNCCSYYNKFSSDLPHCFLFNSRQTRSTLHPEAFLDANHDFEYTITFMWTTDKMVFACHGGDEVPVSTPILHMEYKSIKLHEYMVIEYLVTDEVADDNVRTLPVESRGCRFPDENDVMWAFDYYSYSGCIAQCRVERKMELCNCTDILIGYGAEDRQRLCDDKGIKCIQENQDKVYPTNSILIEGKGLKCNCPLSCLQQSVKITNIYYHGVQKKGDYCSWRAKYVLAKTRRRLRVIRGLVDITVSIGGVFAFFLGASLMSVFEIIYFLTIRPLFLYWKCRE